MENSFTPERVYPVPSSADNDKKFTFGLIFDVVAVLERHGYPSPSAMDYVDLQQALFSVLHRVDELDDVTTA